jgi:4-amino-4-deoxy-L-arabinose transferase-like glycosyltransferase
LLKSIRAGIANGLVAAYYSLSGSRYGAAMLVSLVGHILYILTSSESFGIDHHIYQRVADHIKMADALWACGVFEGSYWPPLFPTYLAIVQNYLGESVILFRLLNLAQLTVAAILFEQMARRLIPETLARWTALLLFNSMILYFFTMYYKYELLAMFLLVVSCWAVVGRDRLSFILALMGGVSLGLAILTSGRLILFAPLVLWYIWKSSSTQRWRHTLLLAIGLLVTIGPWTARNYYCHDRLILLTTNGGINFYTGFLENASGSYERPEDFAPPYDAVALDDQSTWYRAGWEHITNDPWRALRLILMKVNLTWRIHYADNAIFYPAFWIAIFLLVRLLPPDRKHEAQLIKRLMLVHTIVHALFIARYYLCGADSAAGLSGRDGWHLSTIQTTATGQGSVI